MIYLWNNNVDKILLIIGKQDRQYQVKSLVIFVATIIVVAMTLTSIIFPSLIVSSVDVHRFPVNQYELGDRALILLATDALVLGIALLYFRNLLPSIVTRPIRFIWGFEVSRQVALLAMIVLIALYIFFSIEQILKVDPWEDFNRQVLPALNDFTLKRFVQMPDDNNLSLLFEVISMKIFGSYVIIPYISSIALLVLTYLTTIEITKKRFAGLVSTGIMLQSGIFITYSTTATYTNFWALFYLLSIYLIYKKWPFSSASYILAIPSKPITSMYLPFTLLFTFLSDIPRKRKIWIAVSYGIVIVIFATIIMMFHVNLTGSIKPDFHNFLRGFTSFTIESRYDIVAVLFILPLVIGLFIASRNGVRNAGAVMSLIFSMLLALPILPGLTIYDNNPYRLVPLIVFFSIGVGTLFSKRTQISTKA